MGIKRLLNWFLNGESNKKLFREYYKRYTRNAFKNGHCVNEAQYEACITRLYHTVEKGLSYENYRAGFGKDNIKVLITTLESYSREYGCNSEFYETAIDVLQKYINKNREFDHVDNELENRIKALKGRSNGKGGVITFTPWNEDEIHSSNYGDFVKNRHSIRHFSGEPIDITKITDALELAQYTPSACNRQGWRTHVIVDQNLLEKVLQNQNGNSGFGQEIDKLLLITADLCFFNYNREMFQAYIDGGMYAMSVINSLHFQHIASIPLSASLTLEQEKNIRTLLEIRNSEVFILFIGIGNYPDSCQTTRSDRHAAVYEVI